MKKLSKFIYFIFAFALITCLSIFNPAIDFASAEESSTQEGSKSITISHSTIVDTIEAGDEEGLKIPMPTVHNDVDGKAYVVVTDRSGVQYIYDVTTGLTLDKDHNPIMVKDQSDNDVNIKYFKKYTSADVETDVATDVAYIKVAKHGKGTYTVQYKVVDGNKTFYSEVKTVKVKSVAYSWNFESKGATKNIIPATTKADYKLTLPLPTIDNTLDDTTITYSKDDMGSNIVVTNSGRDVTADVLTKGTGTDNNLYFTPTLEDGETSDTYIIKYIAKDTLNTIPDKTFTVKVTKDYETEAELEVTHNVITNVQQGAKYTFPTANVTDKTHNKSSVEVSTEIIIKRLGEEDVVLKNQYDYVFPVTGNKEDTYTIEYKVTDAFGNIATSKSTSFTVYDKKPHTVAFADNYTVNKDAQTGEITFTDTASGKDVITNAEYLIPNEVGRGGFYVPAIYFEDYVNSYEDIIEANEGKTDEDKLIVRKLVATDGSGLEFDIDSNDNGSYEANKTAGLSYNNVVKFTFTQKTGKKDGEDHLYEISEYGGMTFKLVYSVKDTVNSSSREATTYTIKVAKADALTNNVDHGLTMKFPTINDEIDPRAELAFTTPTAKEETTDTNLVIDERVEVRTYYYYGSKSDIQTQLTNYINSIKTNDYIEKYGYNFDGEEGFLDYVADNSSIGLSRIFKVKDGKTILPALKDIDYVNQSQVTIFAVAINDQGQFIIKAQEVAIKNTSTDDTAPVAGTFGSIYTLNGVAENSKFSQNIEIDIPGLTFTDADTSLQVGVRCYVDTPEQTVGVSIQDFVEGCGISSAKLTTTYAGTYYIIYTATDDAGNQTSYMSTFQVASTEKGYIDVENGTSISKNVGDEVVLNIKLAGNGVYDDVKFKVSWGDNKPSGLGSVANSYRFDKAGTYVATITTEYTMNDGAIDVKDTPSVTVTITVTEPTMEWGADINELLTDRTVNEDEEVLLEVISATENGTDIPATPSVVFVDNNDKETAVELTFDHERNCWRFVATEDGIYKVTYTATTEYNSMSKSFNITCGDYYDPTINIASNKLQDSKVIYDGQDITFTAEFKQETSNNEEDDMTGKYILTVIGKNADGKELFNYDINVNLKDTNAEEQTNNFTPSSWTLSLTGDNASSKTTSGNKSTWTISGVGSYELSLNVKDSNGNSATKTISFSVASKTEPKTVKDEVVGIVLIVVSVVLLGGVILFFALAGKRNKAKRNAVRTKKD